MEHSLFPNVDSYYCYPLHPVKTQISNLSSLDINILMLLLLLPSILIIIASSNDSNTPYLTG
ncbi:hypothetical protein SLEP1_g54262 [Rubroshorea leprosula]|uniref:NADH dehydrogenase subunit 5 n=1 Tax=Rubroshorea leprosula TaxID=152421 RepID=A0AAV5MC12_9ROSI|nr:hypothetical protein SLEP1_g54262 [Rubroshorea leprosula]